MKAQLDKLLT